MTEDDILAAHNDHLAAIDGALPAAAPLETNDGSRAYAVRAGNSHGRALARTTRTGPEAEDALWMPLSSHTLEVRLAGRDRAAALSQLLDDWLDYVVGAEVAGERESAASITVPSRDVDLIGPLLERGFAPTGIVGIRRAHAAATARPASDDESTLRRARESDLDRIAELDAKLLHHDARFGVVNVRPGARETLRTALMQRMALAPEWTWVIERGGAVTGFVHVLPPGSTGWFAGQSAFGEASGFLVSIFVDPAERGAGAGALLVKTAHEALDASGAAATTLDYAVANPVSPGFWSRMGYRPLWTTWRRRPARLAL